MTKFVQVQIMQHPNGVEWARANNVAPMVYPTTYDASKVTPLLYDKNSNPCTMVGAVDDANLATVLGDGVAEISRSAAITWGTNNEPAQQTVITDQNAVILILAKVARNQALTVEEENAIDPTHIQPGINQTQTFAAMMDANYPE